MNEVTQSQLNTLEKVLDKLFASLGIDIEFTRHFLDRRNPNPHGRKKVVVERESAEQWSRTHKQVARVIPWK